jgi:predicted NUDIX family NTP pyrophosphohydrolase
MCRLRGRQLQVLLVHPGGPYWTNKDQGAWTIPKGELREGEEPLEAAKREFREETSVEPRGPFMELTPVKQKGGKIVRAWAFEGDCDPEQIRSNTFTMEWPRGSGHMQTFRENDRAAFFTRDEATLKINPAQLAFVEEVERMLGARAG